MPCFDIGGANRKLKKTTLSQVDSYVNITYILCFCVHQRLGKETAECFFPMRTDKWP